MLVDYQTLASAFTRDDAGKLSADDVDRAIAAAVERYGSDRPRQKVEDVTAAGGKTLALPAGWVDGFSSLVGIEHPIGNVPPDFLPNDSYALYQAPSSTVIQVRDGFSAGAVARCTYTIKHVLSANTDTIPLQHREVVACLAASCLCEQLAALYSGDGDSTIQADNVNHQSKAQEFSARARSLRKRYFDELGIDPRRAVAAGAVVDLSFRDSRGQPRLSHPLRVVR
ncbi:MAG: hypothetical protein ACOY4U_04510 [Pseudomonadota bacterium]